MSLIDTCSHVFDKFVFGCDRRLDGWHTVWLHITNKRHGVTITTRTTLCHFQIWKKAMRLSAICYMIYLSVVQDLFRFAMVSYWSFTRPFILTLWTLGQAYDCPVPMGRLLCPLSINKPYTSKQELQKHHKSYNAVYGTYYTALSKAYPAIPHDF